MINNKQVNIWRGDQEPPTLFHVWIYQNQKILLHDGTDWVTFINDVELTEKINQLTQRVDIIEQDVNQLKSSTINNKLIKDNPVLNGLDLKLVSSGHFINPENSISDNIQNLDTLFVTQIIE